MIYKIPAYEKKVKEPYHVEMQRGRFVLKKGRKLIRRLIAASENGADREAWIHIETFLKTHES